MKFLYTLSALILVLNLQSQSISLNTNQVDFGTLTYGDSDSIWVEMTNLFDEEVQVLSVEFYDFYETNPFYINILPSSIPSGATSGFYLVFEPVHNMQHNSELVISTSGNRGAIALDLIGNCTYSGNYYSDTYNLLDEDLEETLHEILGENYQDLGYNGARDEMFMEIENQRVNGQGSVQNRITRAYLGTDAVGYTSRSDAQGSPYNLNTEHTFPQGMFNQNLPMRADIHHLMITDIDANSTRGNLAFGDVVSGVDWEMGGSRRGLDANGTMVFEPRDGQKGKTARAVMYFVLRYQNYGGFLTANQEEDLRAWHLDFLPNEAEMNRNDDIFELQNNRNPFVDYPQFIHRIHNIRLEQERPNIALLDLSAQIIQYGGVEEGSETTYNLVLTNYGERFAVIDNLAISENSTGAFQLVDVPNSFAINPGESASIGISCTLNEANEDLNALFTFNTSAVNLANASIPLEAGTITDVEDRAASRFTAFPNPFANSFTVSGVEGIIEEIVIYDITGRCCAAFAYHITNIPADNLERGLYQVIVKNTEGRVYTAKVLKQ